MALFRISDGCFSEVNEMFLEMTGYDLEEVLGRNSSEIEVFTDPEFLIKKIIDVHCYESSPRFAAEIRKKTGEMKKVIVCARKVTIDNEDYILAHYLDFQVRNEFETICKEFVDV